MSVGLNEIRNFLEEGTGPLHALSDCRDTSLGFNAFALVSDTYRRENFHSDILSAILDPDSKHGEGVLFLRLFVAYLARVAKILGKNGLSDTLAGFQLGTDIRVVREDGRIDVLVEGHDWAIIIENKINGADDMDRQLPRYVEKIQCKGKRVLAIVYITAATAKEPNQYGWKSGDQEMVLPLLLSVVGYNETVTELNLVVGWLERCELEAKNFAAKAVLSQYCELLRNQSGETMNQEEMIKLFSLLGKNKIGYRELLKILHGMPHTLAVMIVDACRNMPGLRKSLGSTAIRLLCLILKVSHCQTLAKRFNLQLMCIARICLISECPFSFVLANAWIYINLHPCCRNLIRRSSTMMSGGGLFYLLTRIRYFVIFRRLSASLITC